MRASAILTRQVRFSYYGRLSRADQGIYRESDALPEFDLPAAAHARALAERLRKSIETGDRPAVRRSTQALADAVLDSMGIDRVAVRVLATRPSTAESELHGLYERVEGEVAVIKVWMKTAAKTQVVKYRTFLRTFLHEICHHLDYDHFGLADSFHTHGFFKRESSLMRQLAPKPAPKREPKPKLELPPRPEAGSTQLELPLR